MLIQFPVSGDHQGERLNLFLRKSGVSLALVRSLKHCERGIIRNGQPAKTDEIVQEGDIVGITLPLVTDYSASPQEIPIQIVYESAHVLLIDKPSGLVMHPTFTHHENTLANGFCGLMESRSQGAVFRPIGRLDGNTSGLVLCAMNSYAAPLLSKSIYKSYLALVGGELTASTGNIEVPLAPKAGSAIEQEVNEKGKYSATGYKVLAVGEGISLVHVVPLTGRTHQIRVHFAYIGHPLLGDGLYGGDTSYLDRHALHCWELGFTEPQGKDKVFYSPLPPDMAAIMEKAGLSALEIEPRC